MVVWSPWMNIRIHVVLYLIIFRLGYSIHKDIRFYRCLVNRMNRRIHVVLYLIIFRLGYSIHKDIRFYRCLVTMNEQKNPCSSISDYFQLWWILKKCSLRIYLRIYKLSKIENESIFKKVNYYYLFDIL